MASPPTGNRKSKSRARRTKLVLSLAFVAMLAVAGLGAPAGATPADSWLHPGGITILGARPPVPAPLPDADALALDEATKAAAADPTNLSFPWFDRTKHQLVVAAATPQGLVAAQRFQPRAATAAKVSRIAVSVSHSYAYLQRILDDAIGAGPLVTVRDDYADPQHNRVILEVDSFSDAFLYQLAKRYDPSAIAVRVVADTPKVYPQSRGLRRTGLHSTIRWRDCR